MNNDLELCKLMFNLKDSLFSKVTKLNRIRYVGYHSFLHSFKKYYVLCTDLTS